MDATSGLPTRVMMAFSTGLRMKGMILSIHHKLVFFIWPDGVNNLWWISKLPVIDMSSDSEWDNAGIIGCIASDWKKVWVPWNHRGRVQARGDACYVL